MDDNPYRSPEVIAKARPEKPKKLPANMIGRGAVWGGCGGVLAGIATIGYDVCSERVWRDSELFVGELIGGGVFFTGITTICGVILGVVGFGLIAAIGKRRS
jgi:hypothetical protein